LSLAALLTHPSWRDVQPMAGADFLDRTVHRVHITAELAAKPPGPGALVVYVGAVEATDWRLDALLRRVSDAEGAGLLLPVLPVLTQSTRLLVDRLRLAVLGTSADPLALATAAAERIAAPDIARARLVLRAHTALARFSSEPEVLARAVSGLLGVPVVTRDREGRGLRGEAAPPQFKPTRPIVQSLVDGTDTTILYPVLAAGGRNLDLWLAATVESATPDWVDTVTDVLAVAASAAQRWRALRRLEVERDARVRAGLLGELLRLQGEPAAALRQRAVDVGWRLDGWHVGAHLQSADSDRLRRLGLARPAVLTRGAGLDLVRHTDEVVAAVEAEAVEAVVVEHEDGWSMWLSGDDEPTTVDARTLSVALRRVQSHLDSSLGPTIGISVGIGRAHPGPEGIRRTLGEAIDAARLAAGRPESGRFLHVDQLGLSQLLLAWTQTDTFQPAAADLLAPLAGQPGELFHTLSVFLDCESSVAETAAVLGVHRNTVTARVVRIQQLLGIDLSAPDERLALHLACRTLGREFG
jgi:purine catabolism regulator